MLNSPLYVITSVFNPQRFKRRYQLYREFEQRMAAEKDAILYTVEVALGERPFEVTQREHPRHLQLRTRHELWVKEAALNLLVQRLPCNWGYVAWVDADLWFARPDWALETIHQLQHTPVVQMFSQAHDLGPNNELLQTHHGFAKGYRDGLPLRLTTNCYYGSPFLHPGFCWGYTRKAWDDLGGLIDFAILGSADHHQACALIGQVDKSMPAGVDRGYRESCHIWQDRAERHIQRHIGCVETSIFHHFHGPKKNRKYVERWSVLIDNKYDAEFDLKRDWQGLWQLTDRNPQLRRDIQAYFGQRNEDDIRID